MYFTYAETNQTFQDFGIWFPRSMTVTGVAEPEQVRAVVVSDGTLRALAVQPALGRLLSREDQTPNGPQRVMLGHGYWKRRFARRVGDWTNHHRRIQRARDSRRHARRLSHRHRVP